MATCCTRSNMHATAKTKSGSHGRASRRRTKHEARRLRAQPQESGYWSRTQGGTCCAATSGNASRQSASARRHPAGHLFHTRGLAAVCAASRLYTRRYVCVPLPHMDTHTCTDCRLCAGDFRRLYHVDVSACRIELIDHPGSRLCGVRGPLPADVLQRHQPSPLSRAPCSPAPRLFIAAAARSVRSSACSLPPTSEATSTSSVELLDPM